MNRVVFLLLLLSSACFSAITYTVDLDREGDASVTVSLVDENKTQVILPQDATNFRIVGGSYHTENSTAFVEVGKTGLTSFSFTTSLLSGKSGAEWRLTISPPQGSTVTVFMPPYSTIKTVSPKATRIFSEDSRIQVDTSYSRLVSISYGLEDIPAAKKDYLAVEYLLLAAAIIIAAGLVVWALRRGRPQAVKEEAPSLEMTEGKKQMVETFNENDLAIVDFLLSHEGKSKRNVLERSIEMSKSSLAVALNRLEKRRIVDIDRSATTHYIRLSDYFLRL